MIYEYSINCLACQQCQARIHCDQCEEEYLNSICRLQGIENAELNIAKKTLRIETDDMDEDDLLDVIDVTLFERSINPVIPHDWYVLEEANINGIVIWQNRTGGIFQTQSDRETVKIADSICGYLDLP